MALTVTQLQALKADILADGTLAPLFSASNPDGLATIAAAYNALAAPDYFVWSTAVPVSTVFDNVTWANYTPSDPADNTVTYQNRAMLCQTKQMNLQLLLQGRSTFDASKTNLRAGLNDATTSLPSGTAGASRSGGWTTILPVLSRKALRVEKLFAVDDGAGVGNTTTDPRGASTNPDRAAFEGQIDASDVLTARNS